MSKSACKKKKQNHNEVANDILASMGYFIGKSIGEGTYSKVCVATAQTSHCPDKVACKIINKKCAGSDFIKKFLPRELKIIRRIEHPNIVTVYDIIEIDHVIYIFMDYCRNGDLLEYIRNNGPLPEDRAKNYFKQIVKAVDYLHNLNISHRDLKCENVLLSLNNSVKIGDFGFARNCVNDKGVNILSETFCGSAAYAAPEILQGIAYDPKMYDMWALGCILFIMLTASMPYDDSNIKSMLKHQLNKSICLTALKATKKSFNSIKCLLSHLLEPNVKRRATIKQVANCMWLQESPLIKCKNALLSLSDSNIFKF